MKPKLRPGELLSQGTTNAVQYQDADHNLAQEDPHYALGCR